MERPFSTPEAAEAARKVLVKRKYNRGKGVSLPKDDPVTIGHLQEAVEAALETMPDMVAMDECRERKNEH